VAAMSEWRDCKLGDVVTLKRGFDLPTQNRVDGEYPVFSSSGITGYHDAAIFAMKQNTEKARC
jgi:type I restriction enzyme S subunit